ncbi:MAG: hypothetical protein ACYTF6_08950 [Planctomycetota bacterium]|jgi:hypothetical protein
MNRLLAVVVCAAASAALAVAPSAWQHSTAADFTFGETDSVVVSSRGEVTLAKETSILVTSDEAPAVVSGILTLGKSIYAAAGNECAIYKVDGKKLVKFAEPPGTLVGCLVQADKKLIAGTCGKDAGIYRIDSKGKAKRIWADEKVKHVWAIVPGEAGKLYAATGPEGKVFAIDAAGKAEELYSAGELAKNILCLAKSADGLLYAGTDESGLVVEIDLASKASRVLLDAAESEISVVIPVEGGILVATADTELAGGEVGPPLNGPEEGPSIEVPPEVMLETMPAPVLEAATRPAMQPAEPPKPAEVEPEAPEAEDRSISMEAAFARAMAVGAEGPMAPEMPMSEEQAGNAVYFIGSDGLVETVFRRPNTILDMLKIDDRLILGTGNGGEIFSVTMDGRDVAPLADTDAKQVTALAAAKAEGILFGTANKGSIGSLGAALAKKGTLTSMAMDAGQVASWGSLRAAAEIPAGTNVTFATRSGNVAEPDEKTWSPWSQEVPLGGEFRKITSPTARYLQYRLAFSAEGKTTPVVRRVELVYQIGNLPPSISDISVVASASAGNEGMEMMSMSSSSGQQVYRLVSIIAADPNQDSLVFTIEFREVGTDSWIKIADETYSTEYAWDTRTVGDGVYEIRATASDSPANPPGKARTATRISGRIIVDNTAPTIKQLTAAAKKGKAVEVEGVVRDNASRIVSIFYAADSADEWVVVLPKDGICDSTGEDFKFELKELEAGAHRIAIRVTDLYGNVSYSTVTVKVE